MNINYGNGNNRTQDVIHSQDFFTLSAPNDLHLQKVVSCFVASIMCFIVLPIGENR
jgi:hypothetical protein